MRTLLYAAAMATYAVPACIEFGPCASSVACAREEVRHESRVSPTAAAVPLAAGAADEVVPAAAAEGLELADAALDVVAEDESVVEDCSSLGERDIDIQKHVKTYGGRGCRTGGGRSICSGWHYQC